MESDIQLILLRQNMQIEGDLHQIIEETIAAQENNIRLICKSTDGIRYIFKYSIAGLTDKTKQTGIRAKLNLENEIKFYRQINDFPKEKVIIPKLIASSTKTPFWLIIEFLESDHFKIFSAPDGFEKTTYPDFFVDSVIEGLSEFHNFAVDKHLFNTMKFEAIYNWISTMEKPPGVDTAFSQIGPMWDKNAHFVSHNDIMPDTLGYEIKTKKLVLIDFEKLQIAPPAFDFSSLIINPLQSRWNEKFEQKLLAKHNSPEFKKLYHASCIMRLISKLNNYKTGRIDYIFVKMLGEQKYSQVKKKFIPLMEQQILQHTESLLSMH